MGTGHVMRCLSLAQAWQDLGGRVDLISRALPPAFVTRLEAEGIQVQPLPETHDDLSATCQAAAAAHWTVLDGYHFDASYGESLAKQARVLMIDDLGQLPYYPAELVLNQNITATGAMYAQRSPHTSLLLGCRHALLRREFHQPPSARDYTLPVERLLVTLGGSDPDNVTLKVINALHTQPQLHAKVLLGAANPRREELQACCQRSGGRIELLTPVENMVPLMDWAQAAVSAGGTSVLELASRGLPTLLIAIADNQLAICRTMQERQMMTFAGWHEDLSGSSLGEALGQFVSSSNSSQRAAFATRGRDLVDGRGASRVAREMMARTALASVQVRPATLEDARPVLDWANDPVTRSVSFTQSEILWEDHQPWFARRLADPGCRLLIGENAQGAPVGMVRFDLHEGVATISINIAPAHRGLGLGTDLLLVACRDLLNSGAATQIRALIKPDNTASQRAFQRAGFWPSGQVEAAGQPALSMVLN